MAETKQISATISLDLANWLEGMAYSENRSQSGMVELLLIEARKRQGRKKTKDKSNVQAQLNNSNKK